jgi:hypothetical protein
MSSLFTDWTHTLRRTVDSHTVDWLKQKATPSRRESFRRHRSKNGEKRLLPNTNQKLISNAQS